MCCNDSNSMLVYSRLIMVVFRVRHKIRDLKSEPNPNQKPQSIPGPKCKKILE